VRRVHSEKVDRGKLIKLKKKAGKVLKPGASVGIVLSKGPR
jgi:beta-lactam-binding protein with PASTA domain